MTIDMTQNRVPYGLMTDDEKAALHEHKEAGGEFKYLHAQLGWINVNPAWNFIVVYRTVPLPKTQDVIAWDRLPAWVEWVARNKSGTVWAYSDEPRGMSIAWGDQGGSFRRIDDFPGIVVQIGTCDWRESKQRRPRG